MSRQQFTAALHEHLARLPEGLSLTLVATLIDGGADINMPDDEGYTPLLRCLKAGCAEGMTAQMQAPLQALVSLLLRHGADMDGLSPQGHSVDALASFWGDDGQVRQRLSCERLRRSDPYLAAHISEISIYWPRPDDKNITGLTRSLMKACMAGDIEKVTYFSHVFPASLSWVDDELMGFEITPVIAAAIGTDARRKHALLEFLRDAGCEINRQNDEGNTALHYVCGAQYRSPDAIRALIALGADDTITNNANRTPRDMTVDRGFTDGRAAADALDQALQDRAAQHAQKKAARKPGGGSFRF